MRRIFTPGRTRLIRPLLTTALAIATTLGPLGMAGPQIAAARTAPAAAGPSTRAAAPVAVRAVRPSAASATLPASTCTLAAGTRTCDLYAKTGTLTLPDGTTAPIWGYAPDAVTAAGLPGPAIIAVQGETLVINLHNVNLPSATSLALSELPAVPDTTGVTAGNVKAYTFSPSQLAPGTYLYEAGLTGDGPRQAAMGLFGALVVRPSSCGVALNCAYGAASAFDDEALLVLSEVDPAFNAAPLTFDMSAYNPKYWLINGKGYPNTDPIATDAGHNALLRYVNAGLRPHSMALLGLHEAIVGLDGQPQANPARVVADTIPAGSTVDAIAAVPAGVAAGTRYALFEGAMHLDNAGILSSPAAPNPANTPIAFGGMLTFLTVAGSSSTSGGPVTTGVAIAPNPTTGTGGATLTATITPPAGASVTAAEYFVDSLGSDGTGTAVSGSLTSVSQAISAAQLGALSSGNHTFYVHGRDSNGVWGAVGSTVLNLDRTGPAVSGITLVPNDTNGTVDVSLGATASDAASGNQNVVAAEFFVDPSGSPAPGSGTAFAMPTPTATVSLAATIGAAGVAALSEGSHTIAIRAEDALGNWGTFATANVTVDKTGPATSAVTIQPNPTNGLSGVVIGSTGLLYERLDASFSDPTSGGVHSNLVAAEYFIDTVGPNGSGGAMISTTGSFGGQTGSAYGPIDLYAITALTQGQHTVYVHALDSAGNWGSFTTTNLVVDRTAPTISAASATPNPNNGANVVTINLTASDPANTGSPANGPASNIVAFEWFQGADPGAGNGTRVAVAAPAPSVNIAFPVNVTTFLLGTYTYNFRVLDAAGNWSAVRTVSFTVNQRPNALFSDGFESGNFTAWSARGGNPARTTVTSGAAQAGTFKMVATISGGTSGFVQDNTPTVETTYHARFYLNPNNAAVGTGGRTIFTGLTGAGGGVFTLQLRRVGTVYSVRAVVNRTGGTTATNWFTVAGTSYTAIEIAWASGTSASFTLYTGGVARQTLTGLNTNALRLETVQLGYQGALAGASGSSFFDSFVSTRTTFIGL